MSNRDQIKLLERDLITLSKIFILNNKKTNNFCLSLLNFILNKFRIKNHNDKNNFLDNCIITYTKIKEEGKETFVKNLYI